MHGPKKKVLVTRPASTCGCYKSSRDVDTLAVGEGPWVCGWEAGVQGVRSLQGWLQIYDAWVPGKAGGLSQGPDPSASGRFRFLSLLVFNLAPSK